MRPRQIVLLDGLRCVAGQLDLVAGQVGISATLAERLTESTVERHAALDAHKAMKPIGPQQQCLQCGKMCYKMFCSAGCKAKFKAGMNRYARELAQLKEPEGSQDLI